MSSARLDAIAFVSPKAGYAIFTGQAGGRCQALAGRTADAGARFASLAPVTSWPCDTGPPASVLAADRYGDAFLYDPGLYVSHDGGRGWAAAHQPGTVLAVAAAGRSIWLVRCGPVGAMSATLAAAPDGTLLAVCAGQPGAGNQAKSAGRSADGGRSWAVHTRCPPARFICRRGMPLYSGYLAQIASVSGRTAFLAGARSSLRVSSDAGRRWQTVRPLIGDGSGGTSQVIFVNPRDGFVLGEGARTSELPTTWRTTDGGMRWSGVVPRP